MLAKSPVPGRAKTRLSPPLSPTDAAAVAEASLADTLEAVAATGVERKILALQGPTGPWLPPGFEVIEQVEGSLNDRLAAAWDYAGGPGLQIGMDTPQVTPSLLEGALSTLLDQSWDAVLGLAEDGGWWGIGMRDPSAAVFDGVAMSCSDTGIQQLESLRSLGHRVAMLPVARDIDNFGDARAVAGLIPGSRTADVVKSVSQGGGDSQ